MTLENILDAESVVIIGASRDVTKRGYQAVKTLLSDKYEGRIYLVNPRGGSVLGLACYKSVLEIDDSIDIAFITTPAKFIPSIIEDCSKKGVAGAVIIAAGYGEIGPEGKALERSLMEKAKDWNVRIVGPNTNGIINFKKNEPGGCAGCSQGDFALVAQSGNMALALMNEARDHGLSGFSYYVGVGNQIDVDLHEYIAFFADDADTRAIVMYLEGAKDGRKFIQEAYKATAKKPIIALKGGRSGTGQKSARSHTGALAGQSEVSLSAFKSAGVTSLDNPDELFPVAETLSNLPPIQNNKIAIFADELGCETVLKIVSPDILHKSDAGGVSAKLKDADAVRAAYSEIVNSARAFDPNADIRGCLVCPMVVEGTELIVGIKHDEQFGSVIMSGLGGILVEIFKDVAFRPLPLDEDDAHQMLTEVKSSVILDGVRGKNPIDKKAVCDLLLAVSKIAAAYPQIKEMDLNPVIATEDGVVVADARILIKSK